jgi:hypothetical protein
MPMHRIRAHWRPYCLPRRLVAIGGSRTASAIASLLLICAASWADDGERMRHAQQALEQTAGLYDRVYARFRSEAKEASGKVTTMEFEWWIDGGNVRAKRLIANPPPEVGRDAFTVDDDFAIRDGVFTTVSRLRAAHQDQKEATILRRSRDSWPGVSLWSATLLSGLDDPVTLWKDFWALKDWDHRPAPAMTGFDGLGVESRRTRGPAHTIIVYLDPAHDYLPRTKLAYQYHGRLDPDKPHVELDVLEYFTRADKLPSAFPKRSRMRAYGDGGASRPPVVETTFTLTLVRVPASIPASTFQVTIPPGYTVADFISGKQYISGPDGGPAPGSKVQELRVNETPPPRQTKPSEQAMAGVPEPEPINWFLYGGIALVGFAGVSILVRRLRRAPPDADAGDRSIAASRPKHPTS